MELRQSENKALVVGKLMDMGVTTGITKKGDNYVSVSLIIQSMIEGKKNENEVKLFATEKSAKLYPSYLTIANEYKSAKMVGLEAADRIRVNGELAFEKSVSKKTGKVVTYRKIRGVFVNRIDDVTIPDEVGAEVECVIVGQEPECDKDGVETGRLKVKLLTVGYDNNITEFDKTFVPEDLAQQFPTIYSENDTALLVFNVYNYSEAKENTEEVSLGFGRKLNNDIGSNNTFVNEVCIIGGNMPTFENNYSVEEIEYMKTLLKLKNDELMGQANNQGATGSGLGQNNKPSGFGRGLGQNTNTNTNPPAQEELPNNNVADDDIPF